MRPTHAAVAATLLLFSARAGADSGDLKRRLESQRSAVADLEGLDQHRAAGDEIALLRSWLDEAWTRLASEEEDQVRLILDRCDAQAVYIREAIEQSKLAADADKAETALRVSRAKVDKTRRDLEQAQIKKKALELNLK
jgi:hypothetical protein